MSRSNHGKGHLTFSSLYLAAVFAFVGDGDPTEDDDEEEDEEEDEEADELASDDICVVMAYLHAWWQDQNKVTSLPSKWWLPFPNLSLHSILQA